MMEVYLYEEGFDNLLSLITKLIKEKRKPYDIKEVNSYQKNLLEEEIFLKISNKQENIKEIKRVVSNNIINSIYYVYLSNHPKKEIMIYTFLLVSLKYKDTVFYQRRLNCVNEVIKTVKRVKQEAHKLKGFLRFEETKNNIYYGKISPDNNVIEILSNHFQKRLKMDYWIIHDTKRGLFAIYDKKRVYFLSNQEIKNLNLEKNQKEIEIEELWKTFHQTVAIKERENKKCQQNFMPKKYWKNMLEMEDKI